MERIIRSLIRVRLPRGDAHNHQEKGYGIRASMKLLKHYMLADFYVEPFIRFWNIEDSKVGTSPSSFGDFVGLEPKNTTTEIGSKFGLQF